MSKHYRWLPVSVLCLMAWRIEAAELLGKISDETASPADQTQPAAADNGRKIIYRVICQPEGEQLPECQQAPVSDSFDAPQAKPAEPGNNVAPATAEQEQVLEEQSAEKESRDEAPKVIAPKKTSAHKAQKKPAKTTPKKAAKKSPAKKPAKTEKKHKHR